jgi:hypothetical protein
MLLVTADTLLQLLEDLVKTTPSTLSLLHSLTLQPFLPRPAMTPFTFRLLLPPGRGSLRAVEIANRPVGFARTCHRLASVFLATSVANKGQISRE